MKDHEAEGSAHRVPVGEAGPAPTRPPQKALAAGAEPVGARRLGSSVGLCQTRGVVRLHHE